MLISIGAGVLLEITNLLEGGRKTSEVEGKATEKDGLGSLGRKSQIVFAELGPDEGINRIAGTFDLRRYWLGDWPESPMVPSFLDGRPTRH